jgi:protocatechuate 3,4-dioxygenase beta subunit
MQLINLTKAALVGFAVLAAAHPGEHHERDEVAALRTREFKANARRGLEACSSKFKRSGLHARAEARRKEVAKKHRKRRHVVRDTESVLNTSHLSADSCITSETPEDVLFASNSTCILNPEGETGPYYVLGEHIRSDLREDEPGVPIILEGQFVDVETCEPIVGLYWDLWNCNSTGVYSGLVATGNGNTDDTSNLNNTALRGVQQSDSDGVVQFLSVFPGHYSGRATHHHMVAHLNVTVLPNNTITGGTVAHIGQAFWDQDIIDAVESTYPYNTNNITITTNSEDRVFSDETANSDSDPVFEYVYLGDSLEDGLFGWLTIAVNVSATYDPNYSFIYTASGGEAVSDSDSSTPGGGNGTAPSGASPSGAAPSGAIPSA